MRNFIVRHRWLIGFFAMLAVFGYLVITTRNISQESSQVSKDNIALTKKVESQQIDTREAQWKGCNRTNERTDSTNTIFNSLYNVALGAAQAGNDPGAITFVESQKDMFNGLSKTNCDLEYPPLPGTPPRKKQN